MRDFIKLNLKIENSDYIEQIVRIAGGNPRIAYMAGKLAIEKNDLRFISNMEELYKSYYGFFLDTTPVLSDLRISMAASIISIFNTVEIEQTDGIHIDIALLENEKKEWDVNINDEILQLLIGYRKGDGLSEAIELAVRYCAKKQDVVKEVYSLFKSYYSVDRHSYDENYYTQNTVIDKLKEYFEYPIIKKLFYQLSCHYLSVWFDSVEIDGDNSLTSYRIAVALSEGSKQYRSKIWDEIFLQSKYEENVEDIIHFLCSYPNLYVNKSTFLDELTFDWQNIMPILDNLKAYLTPFRFAYVCSRYFRMSKSCYNELLRNRPLYWNAIEHFRHTVSFNENEEIRVRKEQWIIHYIKENNNNENVVELFRVLQEMGAEIRKKAVLCFLEYNLDFEMFKRLSLVSNAWSGVASLTEKIMFYEDLLHEMEGIKLLKHKKRIREEIEKWKVIRNRDEVEEILLKLYR